MRAEDIQNTLAEKLPLLVDDFSENVNITNIVLSSPDAETTSVSMTLASGVSNSLLGKGVLIRNVNRVLEIESFERTGTRALITMADNNNHDLTLNSQTTITTKGASESEFNGTFTVSGIPNRRQIEVTIADSGATSASGTLRLIDGASFYQNVNGIQQISGVGGSSLTFFISNTILPADAELDWSTLTQGSISVAARITATGFLSRFDDAYTKQLAGNAWAIVVMGDAVANKSKNQTIDSVDNQQSAQYFEQRLAEAVDVYVYYPTNNTLTSRSASDRCRELVRPICQSILMQSFDTLLAAGKFNFLQITGHGAEAYNSAYYVHRYSFEQTQQMQFEDTIGYPSDDVAFRDINLTMSLNPGTGVNTLDALIDLDAQDLIIQPTPEFINFDGTFYYNVANVTVNNDWRFELEVSAGAGASTSDRAIFSRDASSFNVRLGRQTNGTWTTSSLEFVIPTFLPDNDTLTLVRGNFEFGNRILNRIGSGEAGTASQTWIGRFKALRIYDGNDDVHANYVPHTSGKLIETVSQTEYSRVST